MTMLSNFAPTIQNNVLQLTERNAFAIVNNMPILKSFNQNFDRLFRKTNLFSLARKVQVGLVVTSLTLETYDSLNLWWKREISGERCAKNVIDSCASWWHLRWNDWSGGWHLHCTWTGHYSRRFSWWNSGIGGDAQSIRLVNSISFRFAQRSGTRKRLQIYATGSQSLK